MFVCMLHIVTSSVLSKCFTGLILPNQDVDDRDIKQLNDIGVWSEHVLETCVSKMC